MKQTHLVFINMHANREKKKEHSGKKTSFLPIEFNKYYWRKR